MDTRHVSRLHLTLLLIFVLSGAAGLMYQSIWTQYLGLFLGHAAYAQSLVLILFMGGMGLGAWLVSRWSERVARPLMVYAAIEFLLGLFGLGFDGIYRVATEFAYGHLFTSIESPALVGLVRWGLAALLIFPQCILLGATFPLMSAGCIRYMPESGGRVLSGLYFSNSIGAAAGALIATFVLLPAVGLPGTLLTAGLLNIVVAIAAWPIGKRPMPGRVADAAAGSVIAPLVVLATAAITGLTSFIYEVVWVRMLALAVGSTVHAFELMLAAFIAGLAVGGYYLKSRADRMQDPLRVVAWIQIAMGLAALSSLYLYSQAFEWVSMLMSVLTKTEPGYGLYNLATALLCLLIMFPAAFFAGMTLPLLTLTLLRRGGERVIGHVYAANTIGCIVGVIVAVHVLLPSLGVKYALWAGAALDLLLGVVLFVYGGGLTARKRDAAIAFVVSAAALFATAAWVTFSPLEMASSVYRSGQASLAPKTNMLFYRDGKTATVAMFEPSTTSTFRSIATNGKVDAGANVDVNGAAGPDEYTMGLAALLPLGFIPDATNVGVIGFGSGITTHTLLGSSAVKRVDTIEIEPFMVEAARHFGPLSERAYTDPRSHIIIDDAKAYFAASKEKYDIIVSEPSNPWVNGVATLFSEEFYRFVPRHLSDRGVFVQWLQLYEISPQLVASVIHAMLPNFEDIRVYTANQADLLIVAKPRGKLPPIDETPYADAALRASGARLGVQSGADLKIHEIFGRNGLVAFANMYATPANSDFFPILQLGAPRTRFLGLRAIDLAEMQAAPMPVLEIATGEQPLAVDSPMFKSGADVPRFRAMSQARQLREELLGNPGPYSAKTSLNFVTAASAVRQYAERCSDPDTAMVWFASAIPVASSTIAHLRAADLRGVWIEPVWAKNCTNPSPLASAGLRFFEALAKREWGVVGESVDAILAIPKVADVQGAKRFLLSASLTANAAIGDFAKLDATVERLAEIGERPSFYESWIISWAKLRATNSAH